MNEYVVKRDGVQLTEPMTESEAFAWILNHQSASVMHALKYEGYEIVEVEIKQA